MMNVIKHRKMTLYAISFCVGSDIAIYSDLCRYINETHVTLPTMDFDEILGNVSWFNISLKDYRIVKAMLKDFKKGNSDFSNITVQSYYKTHPNKQWFISFS